MNNKNEKLLLYFMSLWIQFNKNNLNVGRDTLNPPRILGDSILIFHPGDPFRHFGTFNGIFLFIS